MSRLAPLLRQRLRRDAVQLIIWIGGTTALAALGSPTVQSSYGDEQERLGLLATVLANPVILLFRGLPSGAGEDQMVVFLLLPWLLILAALMSSFLAVRHTRGDEEGGRLELLSATPAGRWLPTAATMIHGILANVVLGALVTAVFLGADDPVAGSVLVGLSCALVGILFFGVALVAAQLMQTSRGANSLATWVLVVTFVLAGIGNALGTPSDDLTRMRSSWLTWVSPFGWAENTRAFDEDAWGPIALLAVTAVVLLGAALALQAGRDLGGAYVRERAGRADARGWFSSNGALVGRLSASAIVGWVVGGLLSGVLATSLSGVVTQLGTENPAVVDILEKLSGGTDDLERGIVVVFFVMVGILAACAGVQAVARARQDEAAGVAEAVLATPVDLVRWLSAYVAMGLIAAVLTIAAGVVGALVGAVSATDAGALARDAVIAGAGQLLPAALFVGLTAVVFVLAPRLTIALGWVLVALGATIGLFGPLFGMSESVTRLSPFAAAPAPTASGVDANGVWWVAAVTVVAVAAALALMRRRELAAAG